MSLPRDAAIVASGRTGFGRLNGPLSTPIAVEPGASAIRAGCGQNPARQSSLAAGIGRDINALTLNNVHFSGLAAISDAARSIRAGDADVVPAGGQEPMSQAPYLLPDSRKGWTYANIIFIDSVATDGLTDAFDGNPVGVRTERQNSVLGLTCLAQVEVVATSDQRAAAGASIAEGIIPVGIPQRNGDPLVAKADEGIGANTTTESLARLRPAFSTDGTTTAGNSPYLSDVAAALILVSRQYAQAHGLEVPSAIGAFGQVAGQHNSLHSQPSNANAAALETQGWATTELDLIEINEAFDAVACQSPKVLDYPLQKLNIHGGAIALGHPIGASGARPALTAALESKRRGAASGRSARATADSAVRCCWAARSRRW